MPNILSASSISNSSKFRTVLGLSATPNADLDNDNNHVRFLSSKSTRTTNRPDVRDASIFQPGPSPSQALDATSNHPQMSSVKRERSTLRSRGARPTRIDNQDGPWSVSVAEADARSYTLYIKTPTHHRTLTRSANEIALLHSKIHDNLPPNTPLPACPISPDQNPPPKRRSSFLTTLSRLASPPPRSLPTPLATPPDEDGDPFLGQSSATSTALAAYLTTLSNDQLVRVSRPWKRFTRVRTDDLESTRVERAIKRVRSDLATHGPSNTLAIPPTHGPPSSTAASSVMSIEIPSTPAVPSPSVPANDGIAEEAEPDEKPETKSAPSAEANATPSDHQIVTNGVSSTTEPTPQHPEDVSKPSAQKEVLSAIPDDHPARIPRSASADPDKATRLSRFFEPASSKLAKSGVETETEAEETEAELTGAELTEAVSDAGAGEVTGTVKRLKKKKKEKKPSKKVVITDFEMMRVLGKGCAGKVLLVRHKASGDLYALKAITKKHVLAHQELQHTLTEQAVLKRMAHDASDPFVVKLWWSFHDKDNLFLVMDFHPGGDLATQLARWGRLGRDRARFYAAEIVEGVEGLHAAGVVYRDLKPENILIGGDGHIVLTDFGLSKQFARKNPHGLPTTPAAGDNSYYASSPATPTGEKHNVGLPYWMNTGSQGNLGSQASKDFWLTNKANDLTTTFCGTAEYLAPEVIQGLPYSYEVDWWSFGTMLYEMLTGITPFWANNHSDMYVRVLQDELTFPEDKAMDQDTKSLIRGLLQKNPALRIGEPRIKKHPYFSMIDWQHVYHKRYIPPYIPPIDPHNASDTQNFDDAFLDMDPVLDSELEADATDSEREKSATDNEGADGNQSTASSIVDQSRSPAGKPADDDVFDGYSFKGRQSVLIEDEADEDDGYEGTDEEAESIKDLGSVNEVAEEEELDAGQKTPDGKSGRPATPTPASAIVEAFREKNSGATQPDEEVQKAEERPSTPILPSAATEPTAPASPVKVVPSTPQQKRISQLPPLPPSEPSTPSASLKSLTTAEAPAPTAGPAKPQTPEKLRTKIQPRAVEQLKGAAKPRRERSGVAALDKGLKDVDDDELTERDAEDDDWDFVETPGKEEVNGMQGKSLFARGVVDRYKLTIFRKSGTTSNRSTPRTRTDHSNGPESSEFGEMPASPSPSEKNESRRSRGRPSTGLLSVRKSTKGLLKSKSPPSSFTFSSASVASRPGASSALNGSQSFSASMSGPPVIPPLKPQPSLSTVGYPGSSSEVSFNKEQPSHSVTELSPANKSVNGDSPYKRTPRASNADDELNIIRSKPFKKVMKYTEQGAEKVMSLFSSPRSQTPANGQQTSPPAPPPPPPALN